VVIEKTTWDIEQPRISPSKDYSYLGFACESRFDLVEVFLPDDTSYLLSFRELVRFMEKSGVNTPGRVADFIYNFKYVVWNRHRQTYYPVHKTELMTKEVADSLRLL